MFHLEERCLRPAASAGAVHRRGVQVHTNPSNAGFRSSGLLTRLLADTLAGCSPILAELPNSGLKSANVQTRSDLGTCKTGQVYIFTLPDLRIYGSTDLRICGSAALRIYQPTGLRAYGFTGLWTCEFAKLLTADVAIPRRGVHVALCQINWRCTSRVIK